MGASVRRALGEPRARPCSRKTAKVEEATGRRRADRYGPYRGVRSRHRSVRRAVIAFAGLMLVACQAGSSNPPSPSAQSGLREGDDAPLFELKSAAGGGVRLSDYRGEKPVLLYFSMGPG